MLETRLVWSVAGVLVLGRAVADFGGDWGLTDTDPVHVVAKLLLALLVTAAVVRFIGRRQT